MKRLSLRHPAEILTAHPNDRQAPRAGDRTTSTEPSNRPDPRDARSPGGLRA